jgi:hypothetical protein
MPEVASNQKAVMAAMEMMMAEQHQFYLSLASV